MEDNMEYTVRTCNKITHEKTRVDFGFSTEDEALEFIKSIEELLKEYEIAYVIVEA